MINTKDLRLGNLIYHEDIEVIVESVSNGGISLKDKEGNTSKQLKL